MTELEHRCWKLGWDPTKVKREHFVNIASNRYPMTEEKWQELINSDAVWKTCDICGRANMVNNWPDRKPRTPKIYGFVVCVECDPRHYDDRYMKEGYRILHKDRLRIIQLARVTRATAKEKCLSGRQGCKCHHCAAARLMKELL